MPEDFRVKVGFFGHPKTTKLTRLCGDAGPLCFLRLWAFCAIEESRNSGDLSGMDDDDIEIAAHWSGDRGAFVAALRAVKFLDGHQIHDFYEHQPWVVTAPYRKTNAKAGSHKRWHREGKHDGKPKEGCPLCEVNLVKVKSLSKTDSKSTDFGSSTTDFCRETTNRQSSSPTPTPTPTPHHPYVDAPRRVAPVSLSSQPRPPLPPWEPGTPIENPGHFLEATNHLVPNCGHEGWTPNAKLLATIRAGPIPRWEYEDVIRQAEKENKGPGWVAGKIFGIRDDAAKMKAAPPVSREEFAAATLAKIRELEEKEEKEQEQGGVDDAS